MIEDLPRLAAAPELYYAIRPPRPLPLFMSEGVEEIGADTYPDLGFNGQRITVGVLDIGFAGAPELLGTEIPQDTKMRAFHGSTSGNGDLTGGGTDHGTACAEIIHDVAPGAHLCLANANSVAEMDAAVQWLKEEGVSVISHSVGWFFGPGDGSGAIAEIVNRAIDDDIVWVNAVGNQADAYWEGPFRDTDGDGYHEFDQDGDRSITSHTGARGSEFLMVLTWDQWPYSAHIAFEIEIRENGKLAASTETEYAGYVYAYRDLEFERSRLNSRIDIAIRCTRGSATPHLRLFRLDGDALPEHGSARGSVVLPADVPRVVSVGAYRVQQGFLEDFSSRGPTLAGVAKPEICAPDAVASATTSPNPFAGTSAACPHVAGAAALLLGSVPQGGFFDFRWNLAELRTLLRTSAAPDGFADPDACLWGLLRLPDPGSQPAPASLTKLRLASPTRAPICSDLHIPEPGSLSIRIFDAAGRLLENRRYPASPGSALLRFRWDGTDQHGRVADSGAYFLLATGEHWQMRGRFLLIR
jgi:subtilisin family serine protease